MMSRKPLLIGVAAVIAAVFVVSGGILVYRIIQLRSQNASTQKYVYVSPTPLADPDDHGAQSVLSVPTANVSSESALIYGQRVDKYATPGSQITLKNCQPTPTTLQTSTSSAIVIVNNDDKDHLIMFDPNNKVTVPAKGQKEIPMGFAMNNSSIFAYRCDDPNQVVGILKVTL